jgi:DNA invertase Pin-like site-specific DNA recombinase
MILIAPAGYVLGGINDALETSSKQATDENILTLRMKQERQLKQIEASTQVKIAELQAQNFVAPVVAPQRNTQQTGNKAAIVQLHQQGVKPAEIARQIGVHPSTVTRALQAHSRVSAD